VKNSYAPDVKPNIPSISFPGKYNEGEVTRFLPAETDAQNAGIPDPDNILRGLAIVPLDIPFPTDPAQLALFGRGSYLINAGAACSSCHTNPDRDYTSPNQAVKTALYMGGGRVLPLPQTFQPVFGEVRAMSANLLGQTHGFFTKATTDFSTFLTTITQGVHGEEAPDVNGNRRPLSPVMPYAQFRNLTTQDLEAVFTYFKYIATVRPTTGPGDKVTQQAARYCAASSDCKGAGETCNTATSECIGGACASAADCGACQTCDVGGTNKCLAPAAASTCLTLGI
jgi:hypothetical protein